MAFTVQEIAEALDAEAHGNVALIVHRVSEPASAGPEDLALLTNPKFADGLSQGQARVALLWHGADWQAMGLEAAITARRGRYAMSSLSRMMDPGQGFAPGIHPTAVVDASAQIGADVSIGAFTVIGANAAIGDRCVIGPFCHFGMDSQLGADAMMRDHVSVGARVTIGDRFWAQPGARIGVDGMSFVTPEASGVEKARATLGDQGEIQNQAWARIHSLGAVTIGHDVEIGANSCVDYGTVRDTRIGNGCKIDNLVHIAHNVVIGNDCLLAGQVGIAGSTVIGDNVVMGGQVGVTDNTTVGSNVIAGGASKIMSKVPEGQVVLGYPAVKMDTHLEMYKSLRRLPRMAKHFADLQKTVSKWGSKS